MNLALARWVKLAYRRKPVTSFIFTFSAMNAVIGSVENQVPLMFLGLGGITLAVIWHGWHHQPPHPQPEQRRWRSPHLLPASTSHAQLPMLMIPRKRPDAFDDR
jgi:hypothetical protein